MAIRQVIKQLNDYFFGKKEEKMEENYFTRLNMLLKDNGFTVKYLLQTADMSETSYHSLLRYDNCPRADKAVQIAKLLNTTVEYMVTGEISETIPADIMCSVKALMTLDKAHRTPILANVKSQVEYWKGASVDIVPDSECDISDEDQELLDSIHLLSDRDKELLKIMIEAMSK